MSAQGFQKDFNKYLRNAAHMTVLCRQFRWLRPLPLSLAVCGVGRLVSPPRLPWQLGGVVLAGWDPTSPHYRGAFLFIPVFCTGPCHLKLHGVKNELVSPGRLPSSLALGGHGQFVLLTPSHTWTPVELSPATGAPSSPRCTVRSGGFLLLPQRPRTGGLEHHMVKSAPFTAITRTRAWRSHSGWGIFPRLTLPRPQLWLHASPFASVRSLETHPPGHRLFLERTPSSGYGSWHLLANLSVQNPNKHP